MECQTFCEAPKGASSARSVLLHLSTHRSERSATRDSATRYPPIAGWIALQTMLFRPHPL
jgi:hypothetical protein